MVFAALQETNWFGNEVYKVGKSAVLTAGGKVPEVKTVFREARVHVAIVLAGPAVSAWRASGSKLKAWSSRLVTAT